MLREHNLLELQRNFLAALREPIYGESRERTSLPPRAGTTSPGFSSFAGREVVSTPNLGAVERLELYHRQYWFRLLDSIGEDFPMLRRLLGAETFWRLIEGYLERVPSRSFTLRHLGRTLADFIEIHPDLAAGRPVHASDLARIEYALCEIFEQPARTAATPETLADDDVALQPHLRIFSCRTPADEIWRTPDDQEISDELLAPEAGGNGFHVAVFRYRARQMVQRIEANEFSLLRAISATGSLVQAFDACPVTPEEVGRWFKKWTEYGWLCHHRESESISAASPATTP